MSIVIDIAQKLVKIYEQIGNIEFAASVRDIMSNWLVKEKQHLLQLVQTLGVWKFTGFR